MDAMKMTDGKRELDSNACGTETSVDSHSSFFLMMCKIVTRERISAMIGQISRLTGS